MGGAYIFVVYVRGVGRASSEQDPGRVHRELQRGEPEDRDLVGRGGAQEHRAQAQHHPQAQPALPRQLQPPRHAPHEHPLEEPHLQQDRGPPRRARTRGLRTAHRRLGLQGQPHHREAQTAAAGGVRGSAGGLRAPRRPGEGEERGRLLLQAGRQDRRQPAGDRAGHSHPLRGRALQDLRLRPHARGVQALHRQLQGRPRVRRPQPPRVRRGTAAQAAGAVQRRSLLERAGVVFQRGELRGADGEHDRAARAAGRAGEQLPDPDEQPGAAAAARAREAVRAGRGGPGDRAGGHRRRDQQLPAPPDHRPRRTPAGLHAQAQGGQPRQALARGARHQHRVLQEGLPGVLRGVGEERGGGGDGAAGGHPREDGGGGLREGHPGVPAGAGARAHHQGAQGEEQGVVVRQAEGADCRGAHRDRELPQHQLLRGGEGGQAARRLPLHPRGGEAEPLRGEDHEHDGDHPRGHPGRGGGAAAGVPAEGGRVRPGGHPGEPGHQHVQAGGRGAAGVQARPLQDPRTHQQARKRLPQDGSHWKTARQAPPQYGHQTGHLRALARLRPQDHLHRYRVRRPQAQQRVQGGRHREVWRAQGGHLRSRLRVHREADQAEDRRGRGDQLDDRGAALLAAQAGGRLLGREPGERAAHHRRGDTAAHGGGGGAAAGRVQHGAHRLLLPPLSLVRRNHPPAGHQRALPLPRPRRPRPPRLPPPRGGLRAGHREPGAAEGGGGPAVDRGEPVRVHLPEAAADGGGAGGGGAGGERADDCAHRGEEGDPEEVGEDRVCVHQGEPDEGVGEVRGDHERELHLPLPQQGRQGLLRLLLHQGRAPREVLRPARQGEALPLPHQEQGQRGRLRLRQGGPD